MGLITTIRRRISTGDATEGEYECRGCGARLQFQRQVCPECGGFTIDRVEWPVRDPSPHGSE